MIRRLFCVVLVLIGLTGCTVKDVVITPTNATIDNAKQENQETVTQATTYQTEEPAEEQSVYIPSEELLSDIRSFQVQLGENLFRFPVMYTQFVETGWQIHEKYEDVNGQVKSGTHEMVWFTKDGREIICYLFNPDVSIQPYDKCVISGMQVNIQSEAKGETVFIPGGLQLGVATLDDVVAIVGEADDIYTGSSRTKLTYKTENVWATVALLFDAEGVLCEYQAENPVAPDDYELSMPKNLDIEYVEPVALSTSIEDRIVLFGGDLYKLPAPLSAFIENGWEIEDAEAMVSGRGVLGIDLQRGEFSFRAYLWNYSPNACKAEDAYIQKLASTSMYGEEFMITEKIGMAITETELLDILHQGNYVYKQEEIAGGMRYAIQLDGTEAEDYCSIKFEDGNVSYMAISASEKSSGN